MSIDFPIAIGKSKKEPTIAIANSATIKIYRLLTDKTMPDMEELKRILSKEPQPPHERLS